MAGKLRRAVRLIAVLGVVSVAAECNSGGANTVARDRCEARYGVGECVSRHGKWVPLASATVPVRTTTSVRTTTTTTPPSSNPSSSLGPPNGLLLVAGPYGFLVPVGWTEQPLKSAGGPASYATFSDPVGHASIEYEVSGGETGVIYNPDGSPNVLGALTQVDCSVTEHIVLSPSKASYTCASPYPGFEVNGVVIVQPNNNQHGWRSLQVATLLSTQHSIATQILNSFS